MRVRTIAILIGLTVLSLSLAARADWTEFLGPGGKGISQDTRLPGKWSDTENLLWKAELPGVGDSCPVILGDRVYVTCYTGYGQDPEEPGDMDDLKRDVLCLDRRSGKVFWHRQFEPELPETQYRGFQTEHGYSSSTPTTDGERLYVFFGKAGVYALNLGDGTTLWEASVGTDTDGWGSSNSPVLFENLLIVNASIEDESLVALDKTTGEQVWRADGIRRAWTTPMLVETADKETEVVVSMQGWILGFDPNTGEELWRAEGIDDYTCPSPTAHGGVVYATAGRRTETVAVRAGGRGDVSDSHVLWRTKTGVKIPSPVYHDGHLYMVHDGKGTVICLDAETGEKVYEERLDPRPRKTYAAPIFGDGKLYVVTQHKGAFVVAAQPEYKLLAHNTTGDESRFNASPCISNGHVFLRSDRFLYCIGE